VKAAQISHQAPEWTEARNASAPDEVELKTIISAFIDYIVSTRERLGLQQQQLERASGLAKGSLTNVERRGGSMKLETLVRIAHGLGTQPSELARLLDRPDRASLASRGEIVPVVNLGGVARKTLDDATSEADSVATTRAKRAAKLGRSDTRRAVAKKNSHR